MYIIKPTFKVNKWLLGGLMAVSTWVQAHEGHAQMMPMDASAHANHAAVTMPTETLNHSINKSHAEHEHRREHGGQVYQSTQLDTQWLWDEQGQGTLQSKLKVWLGSDENKLFIVADYAKPESEASEQQFAALYSRNIAEFWDAQAGLNYRYAAQHQVDREQMEGVLGVHGMAPYFFETDAHFYVGENQQWRFALDTERDVLLTQRLIMQPYLSLTWVLQDESNYAEKTGLADAEVGFKTRYEIVKNHVMPFIDVAYGYHKGQKATSWQAASASESGWVYGAGLTLKF